MNERKPTIGEIRARQAVDLLIENIEDIRSVKEWAEKSGISRRWLCKSMKEMYDKPPKIILREIKYEKVVRLIHKDGIDTNCYSVAIDAGFGEPKNVSRFLSSFYDTTFTKLKMDILVENHHDNFLWLNGSKT
jgi:AraC-like DNA-binding protein